MQKKNKGIKKIIICVAALLVLLTATSSIFLYAQKNNSENLDLINQAKKLPASINFWSDYPSDVLATAITQRMTDTELLSQVLMFGWSGAEPNELLFQWVDRGLGSVKVFGWNTDDIYLVAKSVNRLQTRAGRNRFNIPLFVATDQEGGWIRHVKGTLLLLRETWQLEQPGIL